MIKVTLTGLPGLIGIYERDWDQLQEGCCVSHGASFCKAKEDQVVLYKG